MADGIRHNLSLSVRRHGIRLAAIAGFVLILTPQPPASRALAQQPPPATPSSFIENADTLDLAGLQKRFEEIAASVSPGVVAISAAATRDQSDEMLRSEHLNGPKLEAVLDRTTRTVGTGFVIDPDGYIATNEHVVGDAEQIWVTTDDKKVYPAIVVGSDPRADLAVLKIPARALRPVRFAPARSLRRGHWTITLGNPYGLATSGDLAMSVGVVSALDRALPKLALKENRLYNDLIQTTAQINPGNSGGPLFNLDGHVIGINTAVILPQKQTNGIGFAMPVTDSLRQNLIKLKEGQEIVYGYLGVSVNLPTEHERARAGIADGCGVRVESIEPRTPAASVLKIDDLVVSFAGEPITATDQFINLVGRASIDAPTPITLVRDGKTIITAVTATRRPMPSVAINRTNQKMYWRGMILGPIPPDANAAPGGLFVLKVDKTRPDAQGVSQGSILLKVAGKPVRSLIALQEIINDTPAEKCSLDFAPGSPVVNAD